MNLIDCLYALNGWWQSGQVDSAFLYKRIRSEFAAIAKGIGSRKATVLIGPRGCGKSTLLYQTVSYLIRLNVAPKRILIFGGDEPSLFIHNISILEIIGAYSSGVLQENLEKLEKPVYVFIDDVCKIRNWKTSLIKLSKYNIRFLLSAPSVPSLSLTGEEKEEFLFIPIQPLTPEQYTEFYCTYRQTRFDLLTYKGLLPAFSLLDDPAGYVAEALKNIYALSAYKNEKKRILTHYLLDGGYPGSFLENSIPVWQRKLFESVIDSGLFGDILCGTNVKLPEKLKKMLYLIASGNGRERAYSGIGHYLSLNTVTVISHMTLLSQCGLICICENYSENLAGVRRKNKRIYLRDCGIKNALLHKRQINTADIENEVRAICVSLAQGHVMRYGGRVCFWKNTQSETDIVLDTSPRPISIQVVYKANPGRGDLRGLNAFNRAFPTETSIVVTRDMLAQENGLYFIPFWLL